MTNLFIRYSNKTSLPFNYYSASYQISASDQISLVLPPMLIDIGGVSLQKTVITTIDISNSNNWDSATYATAANRAGLDFYIYACQPLGGIEPNFILSANSTYPTGYTLSTSRKIGGFHGLCLSVGTISGHTLTGYLTGSILPQSVWCLKHRAKAISNAGLVYIPPIKKWCAIYLASGTLSTPSIVFGGTILDTVTYYSSVDAAFILKMILPDDYEFSVLASGSNEGTNIVNDADSVTVTAAVDSNNRRMISNYGVESCCGNMWQFLTSTIFSFSGVSLHSHTYTSITGNSGNYTSNTPGTVTVSFSYKDITNYRYRGRLYTQGSVGINIVLAGGTYNSGSYSGSLGRYFLNAPNEKISTSAIRFITSSIEK